MSARVAMVVPAYLYSDPSGIILSPDIKVARTVANISNLLIFMKMFLVE
jgi:hypothetical protein